MPDVVISLRNVNLIYSSINSLSIKNLVTSKILRKKDNVSSDYQALHNINLEIERGRVYGVIGKNGAGKSTLLKILSGTITPNNGTIIRHCKTISRLALGVGFNRELSGRENIFLNAMLLGFNKRLIKKKIDGIIEYSELQEFIDKPVKTYSSGMVSRLGFSICIHLQTEVLLIDETLSVGDAFFKEKSFNSIKSLISQSYMTVVIVSHSLNQLRELCDEIILLDKGKLINKGDPSSMIREFVGNQGDVYLKNIK